MEPASVTYLRPMKMFLLSLLVAATAAAQPVVGPEVRSAAIENLDDYAIAPQRDGFVLAWTANGRLFAGHLDSSLQITAPPLTVPLFDPAAAAALPAIASNGTSVFVAWHERRAGFGETAYMALLSADARTFVRGPQPINITKDGPLATSVNGEYVLYTGDLRYVYDENLDTEDGQFISRNLGAALDEGGTVATVDESGSGFDCRQFCFFLPCSAQPNTCRGTSTVTFLFGTTPYAASYYFIIPGNTQAGDPLRTSPPIIAPNGDSFAGLVRLPDRADIFFSQPLQQIAVPVVFFGVPALAGNGDDVLIVWPRGPLTGMVVHSDGTMSAPFPIASEGYQYKVVSISSNDFLVMYRIDSVIAGRIVHLQTPKRRGAR